MKTRVRSAETTTNIASNIVHRYDEEAEHKTKYEYGHSLKFGSGLKNSLV
jgi:hypothetical protein